MLIQTQPSKSTQRNTQELQEMSLGQVKAPETDRKAPESRLPELKDAVKMLGAFNSRFTSREDQSGLGQQTIPNEAETLNTQGTARKVTEEITMNTRHQTRSRLASNNNSELRRSSNLIIDSFADGNTFMQAPTATHTTHTVHRVQPANKIPAEPGHPLDFVTVSPAALFGL